MSVVDLENVAEVDAGRTHTCARLQNGRVKCWGENGFGQLGDGTTTRSNRPVDVPLPDGASEIALGGGHTCARGPQGQVDCWGFNAIGQLGDGSGQNQSNPVPVVDLMSAAVDITAGFLHTCAALADGSVKCWGANATQHLGD